MTQSAPHQSGQDHDGGPAIVSVPLAAAFVEAKPFPTVRTVASAPPALPIPAPGTDARARAVEVVLPVPGAIITPRLLLRPLTPADRVLFTELLAHAREDLRGTINVHTAPGSPGTGGLSDAAAFDRLLRATEEGEARGTQCRRAAFLAQSGQPVGMVHLLDIQRGMDFRADIGWWVGPRYRGNGLATEMLTAMVRHAHRDLPAGLGLHLVTAAIAPNNQASGRVAERAGFVLVPGARTSAVIEGRPEPHEVWESRAV